MKRIVLSLALIFASNAFAASKFPNLEQVMSDIELSIGLIEQNKLSEAERVLSSLVLPQTRVWGRGFNENPGRGFISVLLQQEQNIYRLSLEEIEELWHHGKYFERHPELGLDFGDFNDTHFNKWNNVYDAILHPATAIVAIRVGNLEQAKNELFELLAHIGSIER